MNCFFSEPIASGKGGSGYCNIILAFLNLLKEKDI